MNREPTTAKETLIAFVQKFRPNILALLSLSGVVILAIFVGLLAEGAAPMDAYEAIKTPVTSWLTACIALAKDLI